MNYYVFTALAKAQAVASTVDAHQGYPLAGTDIGDGVHAPPAQSVTATWAYPLAHPTLPKWAYPADGTVTPIVGPNAVTLGLSAPQALDSTWTGATAVTG